MAVEQENLADFTGGMAAHRASTDFAADQWAKLEGFVIERGGRLRSQWPIHQVKGITNVASLGLYEGDSEVYLVAVQTDGTIKWAFMPDADAPGGDAELNPTWNTLQLADGTTPTNAGNAEFRHPVAHIPLRQQSTSGFREGLLLNSIHIGDGTSTVVVYEPEVGTDLRFIEQADHWPKSTSEAAMPKGEYGALWNGVLVLGDIEWKNNPDADLAEGNKKRHKHSLFLSEVGKPFSWDPLSVLNIGDPHAEITGIHVIEAGLLIFKSSGMTDLGGVFLLRGVPGDYTLEKVRVGIGADRGQTSWSWTGTAAWLSDNGDTWQTDGDRFVRLDWQDLGVDDTTALTDSISSFGPYLILVRDDRIFALRKLAEQEQGSWTELVHSLNNPDVAYGGASGQQFFLIANGGEVWRFTRAELSSGTSERGSGTNGLRDLKVATRTLETGDGHSKTMWQAVGVRASSGADSTEDSEVDSLVLRAGPALDSNVPSLTRQMDEKLNPSSGDRVRFQDIVRGPGPSIEFSAEAVLRGDVEFEQFTIYYRPGRFGSDRRGR